MSLAAPHSRGRPSAAPLEGSLVARRPDFRRAALVVGLLLTVLLGGVQSVQAGNGLHQGYVGTRGIVLDDQGQPTWAEYMPFDYPGTDQPTHTPGEMRAIPIEGCANATVMSYAEYEFQREAYQELQRMQDFSERTELKSRSQYEIEQKEQGDLPEIHSDATLFILMWKGEDRDVADNPVISEFTVDPSFPYNPNTSRTSWGEAKSILVCVSGEKYGRVIFDSPGIIAYETAYAKLPETCQHVPLGTLRDRVTGETWKYKDYAAQFARCGRNTQRQQLELYGPILGAEVDVGARAWWRGLGSTLTGTDDVGTAVANLANARGAFSDASGFYSLPYTYPSKSIFTDTMYVWIRYREIDHQIGYGGVYLGKKQVVAGAVNELTQGANESVDAGRPRQVNVPIETAFLMGTAVFANVTREGVLRIGPGATGNLDVAPVHLAKTAEESVTLYDFQQPHYGSFFESSDGVTRAFDNSGDNLLFDSGLLEELSWRHYGETDFYVFTSDGKLCGEQRGLNKAHADHIEFTGSEFVLSEEKLVDIPGGEDGDSRQGYVAKINFKAHLSTECLPANVLQVVLVNRPTGYIASGYARTQAARSFAIKAGELSPAGTGGAGTGDVGTGGATTGGTGGDTDEPVVPDGTNVTAEQMIFRPDAQLVMRPPNLMVRGQRVSQAYINQWDETGDIWREGATQTRERTNIIAFEGAGLTSDDVIMITTEWYDHDGRRLPDELPGYTGRLAVVEDSKNYRLAQPGVHNTLGTIDPEREEQGEADSEGAGDGKIAHFRIRPGRSLQLVRLPTVGISSRRFYLHVSGWVMGEKYPVDGTKDDWGEPFESRADKYTDEPDPFSTGGTSSGGASTSGGTSTSGGGTSPGSLPTTSEQLMYYRPATYVPVLVQMFDEEATRAAAVLRANLVRENWSGGTTAPVLGLDNFGDPGGNELPLERVYRWVYRPEYSFGLYDLALQDVNITTEYEDGASGSSTRLSFDYELHTYDREDLGLLPFGPDGDMVWALGYDELLAMIDVGQRANFGTGDRPSVEELLGYTPADQLGTVEDIIDQLEPEDFLGLQLYQNTDPGNVLFEMQGLPIVVAEVEPIVLTRRHRFMVGEGATPTGTNSPSTCGTNYRDDYTAVGFVLTQPAEVRVVLADQDGTAVKQLIPEAELGAEEYARMAPGEWSFLIDYASVQHDSDPKITHGTRPTFEIRVQARTPYGSPDACGPLQAPDEEEDGAGGAGPTGSGGSAAATGIGGAPTAGASSTSDDGPPEQLWNEDAAQAGDYRKFCVRHEVVFPGRLVEDRSRLQVGHLVEHGVELETGKLALSRHDFSMAQTVGPELTLTRSYSNVADAATSRMGPGWTHGFDHQVIPLKSAEFQAGETVPHFVAEHLEKQRTCTSQPRAPGCFHPAKELEKVLIPDDPQAWSSVIVNGVVFVRQGEGDTAVWMPEDGSHAKLVETQCESYAVDACRDPADQPCYRFTSKDGTEYWYRIPKREPARFETTPQRMRVADNLLPGIDFDSSLLDIEASTGGAAGTGGTGTGGVSSGGTSTGGSATGGAGTGGTGGTGGAECPPELQPNPQSTRRWYAGGPLPSAESEPVRFIRDRYGNTMVFTYGEGKRLDLVEDTLDRTCRLHYTTSALNGYHESCGGDVDEDGRRLRGVICLEGSDAQFEMHYCYGSDGYLSAAVTPRGVVEGEAFDPIRESYTYEAESDAKQASKNLKSTYFGNRTDEAIVYEYGNQDQCLETGTQAEQVRHQDVVERITYPNIADDVADPPDLEPSWPNQVVFEWEDNEGGWVWGKDSQRIVWDPSGRGVRYVLNDVGRPKVITEGPIPSNPEGAVRRTTITYGDGSPQSTSWKIHDQTVEQLLATPTPSWGGDPPNVAPASTLNIAYEYDEAGNITKQTTTYGEGDEPSSYEINQTWVEPMAGLPKSLLSSRTLPGNRTWQWTYSSTGCIYQVITPDPGHTTSYNCNSRGQVDSITHSDDHVTTYTHNSNFQVTQIARGSYSWNFTPDARGRVVAESNGDNIEVRHHNYDPAGFLVSTVHRGIALGGGDATERYYYDHRGDLGQATDVNFTEVIYGRNARGQVNSVTRSYLGGSSQTRTLVYDLRGQVLQESDWEGNSTTYRHDALGRTIEIWSPNVGSAGVVAREGQTSTPGVTTLAYDVADNVVYQRDGTGVETFFTYDARSRPLLRVAPHGTREWDYPASNELEIVERDENDDITTHQLDARGHRIGTSTFISLGQGSVSHEWRYDTQGKLVASKDGNDNWTGYEYDTGDALIAVISGLNEDPSGAGEPTDDGARVTYRYTNSQYLDRVQRFRERGGTEAYTQRLYPDPQGRPTTIIEGEGSEGPRTASLTYDALGNVISRQDPAGNETWTRDGLGRVRGYLGPVPPVEPCDAVGIAGAETASECFDYDGNGRLTRHTQAGRTPIEYAYYPAGQVAVTTQGSRSAQVEQIDGEGNAVLAEDYEGNAYERQYNSQHLPTRITVPLSLQVVAPFDRHLEYTYDGVGNRIAYNDLNTPDGATTVTYTHDPLGRLTETTTPIGTQEAEYDGNNNLVYQKDEWGRSTHYTYDDLNRLTRVERQLGADAAQREVTGAWEYDDAGNLTKEINPRGFAPGASAADYTTTYAYDERNLLRSVTYPSNGSGTRTETYTYDQRWFVAQIEHPNGEHALTTHFRYDDAGRVLARVTGSAGMGYAYNSQGGLQCEAHITNLATECNSVTRKKTYQYDDFNRLWAATDAVGTTNYAYDNNDNLTGATGPGVAVSYAYDPLQNQYSETRGGVTWTRQFDGMGNVKSQTVAAQTTAYDYDGGHRLTQVTRPAIAPAAARTIGYTYDHAAGTIAVDDSAGPNSTIQVDPNYRRAASVTHPLGGTAGTVVVDYEYTLDNRVESVSAVGESTNYEYNPDGSLDKVLSGTTQLVDHSYYANGQLHESALANGITTTHSYDTSGRKIAITHNVGATPATSATWAFDSDGNRSSLAEYWNLPGSAPRTCTTTYSEYDNANRLKDYAVECTETVYVEGQPQVTTLVDEEISYTFDPNAYYRTQETIVDHVAEAIQNPEANSPRSPIVRAYSHDGTTHRLERVDVQEGVEEEGKPAPRIYYTEYDWDSFGSLDARRDSSTAPSPRNRYFDHNSHGELLSVANSAAEGSDIALYGYDYAGNRVTKQAGAGAEVVQVIHAGSSAIAEVSPSESLHYHGAGSPVALKQGTTTQYYLREALGTVLGVADSSGGLAAAYQTGPFGKVNTLTDGSPNRRVFTDHEHDEDTGLIYFGARSYDPEVGMFLSVDPHQGFQQQPYSLSPYEYAYGDPTGYFDPDGRFPLKWAFDQVSPLKVGERVRESVEATQGPGWATGSVSVGTAAGLTSWRFVDGVVTLVDASQAATYAAGGNLVYQATGVEVPLLKWATDDTVATGQSLYAMAELARSYKVCQDPDPEIRKLCTAEDQAVIAGTNEQTVAWASNLGQGVWRGEAEPTYQASALGIDTLINSALLFVAPEASAGSADDVLLLASRVDDLSVINLRGSGAWEVVGVDRWAGSMGSAGAIDQLSVLPRGRSILSSETGGFLTRPFVVQESMTGGVGVRGPPIILGGSFEAVPAGRGLHTVGPRGKLVVREVAADGRVNLTRPGDLFGDYAGRAAQRSRFTDVIIHGMPSAVSTSGGGGVAHLSRSEFLAAVKYHPNYSGGPIRLLACNTGGAGTTVAPYLSQGLNTWVRAPNRIIWAGRDGRLIVAPRHPIYRQLPDKTNPGAFVNFFPEVP